jgi:propanol-preferring alcohol dehydrogenase
VYVFARSADERAFALSLGATWAGDTRDEPPEAPRAIIDTTPAWTPVLAALRCLAPGGRLVVNAIRKEPDDHVALLSLDYASHLWMERELKSVTNVTRADVRELLDAAHALGVRPTIEEIPLERANEALSRFRARNVGRGTRVLRVSPDVK